MKKHDLHPALVCFTLPGFKEALPVQQALHRAYDFAAGILGNGATESRMYSLFGELPGNLLSAHTLHSACDSSRRRNNRRIAASSSAIRIRIAITGRAAGLPLN